MDENLNPILDFTDDLGFQANYLVSARNHGKVGVRVCVLLSNNLCAEIGSDFVWLDYCLSSAVYALYLVSI